MTSDDRRERSDELLRPVYVNGMNTSGVRVSEDIDTVVDKNLRAVELALLCFV